MLGQCYVGGAISNEDITFERGAEGFILRSETGSAAGHEHDTDPEHDKKIRMKDTFPECRLFGSCVGCSKRRGGDKLGEKMNEDVHSIDACAAESAHACVVITAGVYAIDVHSVDTELLKEGQITGASCTVRKRVGKGRWFNKASCGADLAFEQKTGDLDSWFRKQERRGRTLRLVSYTLDVESAAVFVVEVFAGARDISKGMNMAGKRSQGGKGRQEA